MLNATSELKIVSDPTDTVKTDDPSNQVAFTRLKLRLKDGKKDALYESYTLGNN